MTIFPNRSGEDWAPSETSKSVAPALKIHRFIVELTALSELRDRPAGTVRLTASKQAATSILLPVLPNFLATHPDIRVDVTIDEGLTDIVESRYDAGIRLGEKVVKDMVAIRVGAAVGMAVVGSPAYFAGRGMPQVPQDLVKHRCINYRFMTSGNLYAWEFEEKERSFQVRVDGSLTFNDSDLILAAALAGQGIA